jgi:hypothetical protein
MSHGNRIAITNCVTMGVRTRPERNRCVVRALALSALLLAVGCSGSSKSNIGSVTSAAQACSDQATAMCSKIQSCTAADRQDRYGSTATCQMQFANNCTAVLIAPGTGNTPANVEACAQS